MREALTDLFRWMKLDVEAFESATAVMETANFNRPRRILLDVGLSGVSRLDLQTQLEQIGSNMPIIFMTGFWYTDERVGNEGGRRHFLTKPFKDQDILDTVETAMERDATRRRQSVQRKPLPRLRQASRHASTRSR